MLGLEPLGKETFLGPQRGQAGPCSQPRRAQSELSGGKREARIAAALCRGPEGGFSGRSRSSLWPAGSPVLPGAERVLTRGHLAGMRLLPPSPS